MTEAAFQISKKLRDDSIILVRGHTVDEFAQNLEAIIGAEGKDAVRAAFYDLIPGSTPAPAQNVAPASTAAPAAGPHGQQGPSCQHGQRSYKEGTSANTGRAWKAWMCPAPKGQSCPPEWIR